MRVTAISNDAMRAWWFWRPRRASAAGVRLVVFPHAGAGPTVVQPWLARLPETVEVVGVCLPGRGPRFREPPQDDARAIAREVASALDLLREPYVLFGHSVGALLAFETARACRSSGTPLPTRLVVSAAPAPHLASAAPLLHMLPDKEFLAGVIQLGGIPRALLDESELLDLVLPALRADFALRETYAFEGGDPLRCPITAYAAAHDDHVTAASVAAWSRHAAASFELRTLPGGHFSAFDEPTLVEAMLPELLEAAPA